MNATKNAEQISNVLFEAPLIFGRGCFYGDDVNSALSLFKRNSSVGQSEQSPIAPDADVRSGVEARSSLPDDNTAGGDPFAAEFLDSQPLAVAVATVARTSLSFLMRHITSTVDFLDFDDGQILPMSFGSMIALATFHFESGDFCPSFVGNDVRHHGGRLYGWRSNSDGTVCAKHQNAVKRY